MCPEPPRTAPAPPASPPKRTQPEHNLHGPPNAPLTRVAPIASPRTLTAGRPRSPRRPETGAAMPAQWSATDTAGRLLAIQAGHRGLNVPKLRTGSFMPSVVAPRRRIDPGRCARRFMEALLPACRSAQWTTASQRCALCRASQSSRCPTSASASTAGQRVLWPGGCSAFRGCVGSSPAAQRSTRLSWHDTSACVWSQV